MSLDTNTFWNRLSIFHRSFKSDENWRHVDAISVVLEKPEEANFNKFVSLYSQAYFRRIGPRHFSFISLAASYMVRYLCSVKGRSMWRHLPQLVRSWKRFKILNKTSTRKTWRSLFTAYCHFCVSNHFPFSLGLA